jgi:pantetheine-phosphate adenylyltransferase
MAERRIPITGHTELITLLATPIRHSMSPAMHNAAFDKLGMDKVYVLFEVGQEGLEDAVKGLKGVSVDSTHGLTVEYAKEVGAEHLIRGIRAVTDYEYEFALAEANRFIDSSIDMVFFMANADYSFISSSAIDNMQSHKIDISKLVPKSVVEMYKKK